MSRNITFNADADLIDKARARARQQHTSLNAAFRLWLESYAGGEDARQEYEELMHQLDQVRAGGHFSRDQMNER